LKSTVVHVDGDAWEAIPCTCACLGPACGWNACRNGRTSVAGRLPASATGAPQTRPADRPGCATP